MANVAHLLSSEYMNGQEIGGFPQVVTVKSAEIQTFDNEQKVVLSFHEQEKALPLNKTRLRFMVANFGGDTNGWVNRKIAIFGQQLQSGKFAGQWTIYITQAPEQPVNGQHNPITTNEISF